MNQAAAVLTMFCTECGRKVASDEKFCRVCGKALQQGTPADIPAPTASTSQASVSSEPPTSAAAEATQPTKTDPMLAVRVILLIGAGISAFTAPMFITLLLGLAWLVVMFIPKKPNQ
jgi:hypothetical protein